MSTSAKSKTIGKAATTTSPVQKSAAHAEGKTSAKHANGTVLTKPESKGNGFVQAKLAIGKANDPLEHQADAMAQKVVSMSDSELGAGSDLQPGRSGKLPQAKNNPGLFLFRKPGGEKLQPLPGVQKVKIEQEKNQLEANTSDSPKETRTRQLPHELNERQLRKKGEEKVQQKEDEKVKKKEEPVKKSADEKIAKAEQKPQLMRAQVSAKAVAPVITPKEEEKVKKKEEPVKKSADEKIAKAEQKPQMMRAQVSAKAVAPAIAPKEEEKVKKKEEPVKKSPDEKIVKAEQKPQLLRAQATVNVPAATVSRKEEEKVSKKEEQVKKASEEKVSKTEQKPQMLRSQTVAAATTVSRKEEEKVSKKEEQVKKASEEKVSKTEQKPQMQRSQGAVPAVTVSRKEEDKVSKKEEQVKKASEEKVSKTEQKPQLLRAQATTVSTGTTVARKEEEISKKEDQLKKASEEKVSKSEEKAQKNPLAAKADEKPAMKESVQRESEGENSETFASPEFEARLSGMMSGGTALAPSVRAYMDRRFGVDFALVRIHTDTTAIQLCNEIGAQAFAYRNHIFFNRGKYNPDTTEGRFLLAHELTHVIQQGYAHPKGGKDVPAPAGQPVQAATEEKKTQKKAEEKPQASMQPGTSTAAPKVRRLGWDTVNNAVRRVVPVWTLLTVIMGYNPILGESVARNTAAWFGGLLDLIPVIGPSINDKLRESGLLAQAAAWFDSVFSELPSLGEIRSTWDRCWSEMGITEGIDGNIAIFQRHFGPVINRIVRFANKVLNKVVEFLRQTLLRPLNDVIKDIPGWGLITTLIGTNPLTGEAVERSPLNILRGVCAFIPGGQEKLDQLVQSRALEKAYNWFVTETTARNLTWERIRNTFTQAWDSLSANDILAPIAAFRRLAGIFSPVLSDLAGFCLAALEKLLEFIFETVMGAGGAQVLAILKKVQTTFMTIIRDPVRFLGNLVRAVGQGIRQFGTNILTHLRDGVIAWLTGPIAAQGIQMPERWDLKGFIWFGLQILGLTWNKIRERMVRILGPRVVTALETGFEIVMEIREKGIVQALKDRVMEFFGGLKDLLLQKIRNFIIEKIVTAGIQQLVALLSPVGAVIDAILKTYNTIMFFIDNIRRILEFVNSVIDSVAAIAAGSLGQAANFIERTMARTIPILLDFLARFLGLGNVAAKVKQAIEAIQNWVGGKLDAVINWVKNQVGRLIQGGRDLAGRVMNWWTRRKAFTTREGETHTLFFRGEGRSAKIMVASTEQEVDTFLQNHPAKTSGHAQNSVWVSANQQFQQAKTQIAALQNPPAAQANAVPPTAPATAQSIDAIFNSLSVPLGQLGFGGSQSAGARQDNASPVTSSFLEAMASRIPNNPNHGSMNKAGGHVWIHFKNTVPAQIQNFGISEQLTSGHKLSTNMGIGGSRMANRINSVLTSTNIQGQTMNPISTTLVKGGTGGGNYHTETMAFLMAARIKELNRNTVNRVHVKVFTLWPPCQEGFCVGTAGGTRIRRGFPAGDTSHPDQIYHRDENGDLVRDDIVFNNNFQTQSTESIVQ